MGDEQTWISTDETRRVAERLVTNCYPQARITEELGMGRTFKYRFEANGTNLPVAIVVDREKGKAKFEDLSR